MPRLQKFRDDLPDIDLRIQTADRDLDLHGRGHAARHPRRRRPRIGRTIDSLPLADGGDLRGGRPGLSSARAGLPADRRRDWPHTGSSIWRNRIARQPPTGRNGSSPPASTATSPIAACSINDYVLVIQAVMEGQGIALGWRHLTDRLVASGLLVQVTDHVHENRHRLPRRLAEEPRADATAPARCATGWWRRREFYRPHPNPRIVARCPFASFPKR